MLIRLIPMVGNAGYRPRETVCGRLAR